MTRGRVAQTASCPSGAPMTTVRAAVRSLGTVSSCPRPGTRPRRPYACASWPRRSLSACRRRRAKLAKFATPTSSAPHLSPPSKHPASAVAAVGPHRSMTAPSTKLSFAAPRPSGPRNTPGSASTACPETLFSSNFGASPRHVWGAEQRHATGEHTLPRHVAAPNPAGAAGVGEGFPR